MIPLLAAAIQTLSFGMRALWVKLRLNIVPVPSYQCLVFTSPQKYLDKKKLESDSVYTVFQITNVTEQRDALYK